MNILVLGFTEQSREFVGKLKRFSGYGKKDSLSIYHIFVTRNSLSYGEDLVVEIPDPHGDGYRTYRDGLQAVDGYSTTVSDYVPWLLEEARGGSFGLIVNFMPDDDDSRELLLKLKENTSESVEWLTFSEQAPVSFLLDTVQTMANRPLPIEYIEFSREFLDQAERLWQEAKVKMRLNHISNRAKDIEVYGHPDRSMSGLGYAYLPCIPPKDLKIVDHVTGRSRYSDQAKSTYHREYVDVDHKCLVIEDSILVDFLGKHYVEQVACRAFSNPYLQAKSARYVKYLETDSTHMPNEDSDYVVEFVYKGNLKVLPTREPLFIEYGQPYEHLVFSGAEEGAGYPYRPSTNPPADRIVELGLETIVFTFEEKPEEIGAP